jgi:hypothetical protein
MSFLTDLLGDEHTDLLFVIDAREKRKGFEGMDSKLVGELHQKRNAMFRELKLDPSDTTVEELYHSLNNHYKHDSSKKFWNDYLYVGCLIDGELVSMSVSDVEINTKKEFSSRSVGWFRERLANEIKKRYGISKID